MSIALSTDIDTELKEAQYYGVATVLIRIWCGSLAARLGGSLTWCESCIVALWVALSRNTQFPIAKYHYHQSMGSRRC
jgi:hypothetical protein